MMSKDYEITNFLVKPPKYRQSSEELPSYKPSLEFYGLALLKTEFITPYARNNSGRSWQPVGLELNSTQLRIYNLTVDKKMQDLIVALYREVNYLKDHIEAYKVEVSKSEELLDVEDSHDEDAYSGRHLNKQEESRSRRMKRSFFRKKATKALKNLCTYYSQLKHNRMLFEPVSSREQFSDFKANYVDSLIASYTLSNLSVGEAPSLKHLLTPNFKEEKNKMNNFYSLVNYSNTLRLRIEMKQILLQFWSFYGMIHWFRHLKIGCDLSAPLEIRNVCKLKSIPCSRSQRNDALLQGGVDNRQREDKQVDFHHSARQGSAFSSIACTQAERYTQNSPRSDNVASASSLCNSSSCSIFSNELISEQSLGSESSDQERCTRILNGFPLTSYENYYSEIEKLYISNCIPDLNSFEEWDGKWVTISNYLTYVNKKCADIEGDLYVAPSDLVRKYQPRIPELICRTFIIDTNGLVALSAKV